jgi:hypothetical protein
MRGASGLVMVMVVLMVAVNGAKAAGPSAAAVLAAGRCETFDQQPTQCIDLLQGSEVWVSNPYGLTQEYFNAVMISAHLLDPVPLMPYQCAVAYLRLICSTALRPCAPAGTLAPEALPLSVCQSACESVNEVCQQTFAALNTSLPCATQRDPLTGGLQWPETGCLPAGLLPPINTSVVPPVVYPCPEPLVFVGPGDDAPFGPWACAGKCHDKLRLPSGVTYEEYDERAIVWEVFNWISFVSVMVTLVILFLSPASREFPARLVCDCCDLL